MKLSQTDLSALTQEQVTKIIFDDVETDNESSADVALVLGTPPDLSRERAEEAALLYKEGKVKILIPTGGVEWDTDGVMMSEAHFMKGVMLSMGVPEEAIILENQARYTSENMRYGAEIISTLKDVKSVCIVTSIRHMRRSLILAHNILPKSLKIFGTAAQNSTITKDNWFTDPRFEALARNEVKFIKEHLIDKGQADDIEF